MGPQGKAPSSPPRPLGTVTPPAGTSLSRTRTGSPVLCPKPSASPGSCPEPHRLSFQEEEHRLGQGLRTHSCSEKVFLSCGSARAGPWVTRWGLLGLAGGPHLRERGDARRLGPCVVSSGVWPLGGWSCSLACLQPAGRRAHLSLAPALPLQLFSLPLGTYSRQPRDPQ